MANFINEIKSFPKSALRTTSTLVTTPGGRQLKETLDADGTTNITELSVGSYGFVADYVPDLQVAEVLPGLIMGSQDVATDLQLLSHHMVTHILNVASFTLDPTIYTDHMVYKHTPILDLPDTDISCYFDKCFSFIESARQDGCVFVHCNAGVSRSAAIVIAYLMYSERMAFDEAFAHLKSCRPSARPNDGFMATLRKYKPQQAVRNN
ncbi:Dual specificity protein phosphatase 19 [Lamellibrachia satsuma]|nr:Dual specificity protein phosphatase 19 [Lamellibrachia satsuma]